MEVEEFYRRISKIIKTMVDCIRPNEELIDNKW